jgi:hypothetical protein
LRKRSFRDCPSSIVCNAFYWNLAGSPGKTADGFEKTFQVNHVAHVALVLLLLGSFSHSHPGRVVLFSSDAHWPGKNSLAKIPPAMPEDLDLLVHPNERGYFTLLKKDTSSPDSLKEDV